MAKPRRLTIYARPVTEVCRPRRGTSGAGPLQASGEAGDSVVSPACAMCVHPGAGEGRRER